MSVVPTPLSSRVGLPAVDGDGVPVCTATDTPDFVCDSPGVIHFDGDSLTISEDDSVYEFYSNPSSVFVC